MTDLTLRLLGSALLIAAGTLLGQSRLTELQRRARCLRELCDGLGRMLAELETLQSPLKELLSHLTDIRFFRLVSAGLGGEPVESLWRRAAAAMPLSSEERDTLAAPGAVLGRCDAQRACAELALARASLTVRADLLEREIAARGKRFAGLGAALGAIVAAVLF